MAELNKRKQQEKVIHIGSMVLALFSVVVFWQLGGGTASNETDETTKISGINTSMPEIGESVRIGKTRSENISYTAQIDEERQKKDAAAATAFAWFDNDKKKQTATPSSEYEKEVAKKTNSASTSEELQNAIAASDKIISSKSNSPQQPTPTIDNNGNKKANGKKKKSVGAGVQDGESLEEYTARRQAEVEARRTAALEEATNGKKKSETENTQKEEAKEPVKEEKTVKQSFYNLDGAVGGSKTVSLARAVVHGTHSNMKSGSVVKLRLLDAISVEGKTIPRNSFVYGVLQVNGNRANIKIDNINLNNQILPLTASIYDQDGMEGIYIPGNVVSDTKDKAGADVISSVDVSMPTSVNSLVSTGVNAVTSAVKSASASSVRETKISISTNYQVLIKIKE